MEIMEPLRELVDEMHGAVTIQDEYEVARLAARVASTATRCRVHREWRTRGDERR